MSGPSSNSAGQLRSYVERAERLDEEIAGLNTDKKELFAEAKGNGFDVKALKQVLSIRRKDPAERAELNAVVALYLSTLGMADEAAEVEANDPVQAQARSTDRANEAPMDWALVRKASSTATEEGR